MKYKHFFTFCLVFLIGVSTFTVLFGKYAAGETYQIPSIITLDDRDNDGIDDITDLLLGARGEIKNKTHYKSAYYAGGYPPKNEGVCSDVIWRAFKEMGYDLKEEIDKDIARHTQKYPRVGGKPDPNIDFRRVPNLKVFFERKHENLTTEIIPGNMENLQEWQAGDIVIFGKPKDHIAIISDRRNKNGVPYIIHNSAPTPREDNWLEYWDKEISPIIGHYRIVKNWEYKE